MYYPVIMNNLDSNDISVEVPDLPGCKLTIDSIDEGLVKVKEAIANHLQILAEYGESIPTSKPFSFWQSQFEGGVWAIVEFDITPYLGKSHKINVTLPELLIKQIDGRVNKSENYKTRSGFIASACLIELAK